MTLYACKIYIVLYSLDPRILTILAEEISEPLQDIISLPIHRQYTRRVRKPTQETADQPVLPLFCAKSWIGVHIGKKTIYLSKKSIDLWMEDQWFHDDWGPLNIGRYTLFWTRCWGNITWFRKGPLIRCLTKEFTEKSGATKYATKSTIGSSIPSGTSLIVFASGVKSDWTNVESGIPQWSVLWPIFL